jgi:hypothetical protein
MWIPRPFFTKNLTHDISYYLTYLIVIWWLFALLWLFVTLKCERERLTRFLVRQAMLPRNTGGQACTFSEDSLRFACFITTKRPPCTTAVNTSHPAQQPQPMVHQPCEGERVILDGRKRDRIRNQVLSRFLTRARSYARERACKLASAPIMRLYTCARDSAARASMFESVLHAREGRKELSWWT